PPPSPTPAAVAPAPDPAELAMRRLADLRARPPRGDDVVRWYVDASDVVRDFAAARFAVPAARMTSEELVAATSRAPLADVLARCDAVKFAAYAPAADDASSVLDAAETFVAGARSSNRRRGSRCSNRGS